jgi:hypothetical protein
MIPPRKLNNTSRERGGVLVGALFLLPLLAAAVILWMGHYQSIQSVRWTQQQCRTQSQSIHKELKSHLELLMKTNDPLIIMQFLRWILRAAAVIPYFSGPAIMMLRLLDSMIKVLVQAQNLALNALSVWWLYKLSTFHDLLSKSWKAIYTITIQPIPWPEKISLKIAVRRSNPSDPESPLAWDKDFSRKMQLTKIWIHKTELHSDSFLSLIFGTPKDPWWEKPWVVRGCHSRLEPADPKSLHHIWGTPKKDPSWLKVRWFF